MLDVVPLVWLRQLRCRLFCTAHHRRRLEVRDLDTVSVQCDRHRLWLYDYFFPVD